jgi:YfiH family protein
MQPDHEREIDPDWLPATGLPPHVAGLMTTRAGGVSTAPFGSMNLRPPGLQAGPGDALPAVQTNQQRLRVSIGAVPVYLNQVHGRHVVQLTEVDKTPGAALHDADASVTNVPGLACTVLVADCLPVLFGAPEGRAVAAAHAGWRGLAEGVLEATVEAVCDLAGCAPSTLAVWLGACIGPDQFEVGVDVLDAFGPALAAHFVARPAQPGKWLADLPGLARARLTACGVSRIAGGHWCTVSATSRFFSYRRDRVTGRHAAAVWIVPG